MTEAVSHILRAIDQLSPSELDELWRAMVERFPVPDDLAADDQPSAHDKEAAAELLALLEEGEKDVAAGRVLTHEQAKARMARWLTNEHDPTRS